MFFRDSSPWVLEWRWRDERPSNQPQHGYRYDITPESQSSFLPHICLDSKAMISFHFPGSPSLSPNPVSPSNNNLGKCKSKSCSSREAVEYRRSMLHKALFVFYSNKEWTWQQLPVALISDLFTRQLLPSMSPLCFLWWGWLVLVFLTGIES